MRFVVSCNKTFVVGSLCAPRVPAVPTTGLLVDKRDVKRESKAQAEF
jgi:hypothetical protein